jgi:tRNA threonylcarbamoyladenosine biosynthesis protein TsaB
VTDGVLTAEYTVNFKKTHSQTLLPMLNEIGNMVGLDMETVDAIAVSGGPGSFTGLRIGSATAKGLGLALKKPLISIPTIDAMAYNLYGSAFFVCPIMDARRNQVYTGIYDNRKGFSIVKESCAMDINDLIEELNAIGQKVIFLGDGVPVYKEQIEEQMKVDFQFAPAHINRQRAAAVAALGCQYYEEGKTVTAAEHAPVYLRKPQAEREREAKLLHGDQHDS